MIVELIKVAPDGIDIETAIPGGRGALVANKSRDDKLGFDGSLLLTVLLALGDFVRGAVISAFATLAPTEGDDFDFENTLFLLQGREASGFDQLHNVVVFSIELLKQFFELLLVQHVLEATFLETISQVAVDRLLLIDFLQHAHDGFFIAGPSEAAGELAVHLES